MLTPTGYAVWVIRAIGTPAPTGVVWTMRATESRPYDVGREVE